jgi:ELWxxDGT repeat protein
MATRPINNYPVLPRTTAVVGTTLFFVGYDPATGVDVWKTDGTEAGTVLVHDVHTGTWDVRRPGHFVPLGEELFFSEETRVWKSDGTAAGTVVVKQFWGPTRTLAALGGRVLIQNGTSDGGGSGAELWITDGTTEGTVLLMDINPGVASSDPGVIPADMRHREMPQEPFAVAGDVMYFAATTAAHGRELWQTDGTPEGTRLVADAVPGAAGSSPGLIAAHGGAVYFTGRVPSGAAGDVGLYRVTPGGDAVLLHSIGAGYPLALSGAGDRVLFLASGPLSPTLYTPNEAGAGLVELRRFDRSLLGPSTEFVQFAGATYFGLGTGIQAFNTAFQLWRTDGTAAGTTLVAAPTGVIASAERPPLVVVGNALYFVGGDGVGAEPWVSDGTPEGTRELLDINAGLTYSAHPTAPVEVNGRWLFSATDGVHGRELWATDGTEAGTRRMIDPATGRGFRIDPAIPTPLSPAWNGRLYFGGFTSDGPVGLFSTDGTPEGTALLSILPNSVNAPPRYFTPFNGRLYFTADNSNTSVRTVWSTDGTAAGTTPVKQFNGVPLNAPGFTVVGDFLYFAAAGVGLGVELWKTDGTEAGTVPVKDIFPGTASSNPSAFTGYGGNVYFSAAHPDHGRELWRSDGTDAGTVLVADTYPGRTGTSNNAGSPASLRVVNGSLLFEARDFGPTDDGERVRPRVWRTDGTPGGTQPLTDGNFSLGRIAGFNLIEAGGVGYFFRQRRDTPAEMWRTDGTPEGTALVKTFDTAGHPPLATPVGANGAVVYVRVGEAPLGWSPAPSGASELWQSDGTAEGTLRLFSGRINARPDNAVFADGRVLFTADEGVYGRELWVARPDARVVGRHVFYNGSAFDGNDPAANGGDDGAIARDKVALLPGQAAGSSNVTGYSRGINGVMIDVANLPANPALTADDFTFRFGRGAGPSTFSTGPSTVRVGLRRGAGINGSDRVTLVWTDGAVRNAWLQVTVKANGNTGLSTPDVFSFGNLVGETGDSGGPLRVSAADVLAVRRNLSSPSAVAGRHDFNRDGRVDVLDLATVRGSLGRTLLPPAAPAPAMETAPIPASVPFSDGRSRTRRGAYELLV